MSRAVNVLVSLWTTLLLVISSAGGSLTDDWKLVTLQEAADKKGAVCLDGTAPVYYIRSVPHSSKWIVFLQGGGWCASVDECYWMSTGVTGSNASYIVDKDNNILTFQGGAHGFMSSDPTVNPDFWNFNKVIVRSCDGGSWSGDVEDAQVSSFGVPVWFRGWRILKATMESVLQRAQAGPFTELILSGCSSGGHAVWMHLDHVRDMVPKNIRVVGVPQSGLFLNINSYTGSDEKVMRFKTVYDMMGMWATLNKQCHDDSTNENKWMCFMAEKQIPYIKTPYFAVNSMYDSWGMTNIANLTAACSWAMPWGKYISHCNAKEIHHMEKMRRQVLSGLNQKPQGVEASYFVHNCVEHCGVLQYDHQWTRLKINGRDVRTALGEWYYKNVSTNLAGTFAPNMNVQCRLGPQRDPHYVEKVMESLVPSQLVSKKLLLI